MYWHSRARHLAIVFSTIRGIDHFVSNDLASLYHRFREEYRLERKILSNLSPEISVDQDLSEWLASASHPSRSSSISRVVILHNDKVETFHDDMSFDTPEFWSGSITWW